MLTPLPCVTCHVSHVRCHVSGVRCHVSCVTCIIIIFFGKSGGASRWRVCYQRGPPRLVLYVLYYFKKKWLNEKATISVLLNVYSDITLRLYSKSLHFSFVIYVFFWPIVLYLTSRFLHTLAYLQVWYARIFPCWNASLGRPALLLATCGMSV